MSFFELMGKVMSGGPEKATKVSETSIAVMHPEMSLEVQLDEHKLLVVYAQPRLPFERILRDRGLERNDRIRFISQGEHLHTSHARHARQFEELAARIGAC